MGRGVHNQFPAQSHFVLVNAAVGFEHILANISGIATGQDHGHRRIKDLAAICKHLLKALPHGGSTVRVTHIF